MSNSLREWWYSQPMVLYNLMESLKFRFLSEIKADPNNKKSRGIFIRYYMGYKLDMLKDSLERLNVKNDTTAKLYFDLSMYKDEKGNLPLFSYEQSERKKKRIEFTGKIGEEISGKWKEWIQSTDFAIDIDNPKPEKSREDAKMLKNVFDYYKLPYTLNFSGSHGFHFRIDAKYIDLKEPVYEWAGIFGKVTQNLAGDEFGVDEKGVIKTNIDFSIYDPRRVLKLPYSLVNKDNKEYVVLPLSDEQFDKWKLEDMKLEKVTNECKLFKRGLLERTHGLSESQLKLNVLEFLRDYGS